MTEEQMKIAKKMYELIRDHLGDSTVELILMKALPSLKEFSPDKIFFLDSLRYMAYISNADGKISVKEANLINFITGNYISVADLNDLVSKEGIMRDFEKEVPVSVVLLCQLENWLYKNSSTAETSIMNIMVEYFEYIGKLVAAVDDGVSNDEEERLDAFMDIIKEYAEENTLSPFYKY